MEAFLRFLWTLGRSPLVVGSSGTWSTALVAALGSVSFREEPHWLLGSPELTWLYLTIAMGPESHVRGPGGDWKRS